jgi:Epoxide hydrolase N terminus
MRRGGGRPSRCSVEVEHYARRRLLAGRAAGGDGRTRPLLGDGVRLAPVRGKADALPHFITEIDGLDIHFIHVRSPRENALPVIITHGWPGSVIELPSIIGPLTNPAAYGASGLAARRPGGLDAQPRRRQLRRHRRCLRRAPRRQPDPGRGLGHEPALFIAELRAAFRSLRKPTDIRTSAHVLSRRDSGGSWPAGLPARRAAAAPRCEITPIRLRPRRKRSAGQEFSPR